MVKFTGNEKIVSQENPMMRIVVILVGSAEEKWN